MLAVENLHLNYGGVLALKGVTLEVRRGEIVTLIGSNGAGKTSTLNTISGVNKSAKGKITFLGKEIQGLPAHRIARMGIIQAPEGRQVFAGMTVLENLEIGAMGRKTNNSDRRLEEVWSLFPKLQERRNQVAGTLSGGEQQMLAIGRAMMAAPELLMMDEPSLGLAPLIVEQIFKIIVELRNSGRTILLVEQNAWMALQVSDRGYVLENGRCPLWGKADELIADETVKKIYLGGH
jgi:branched-chain amino acid transport system ATP-binding protein